MSLTVQNLRAVGTGIEPTSLLPGQIAFNITDKVLYVGDGSSFKTDFQGNQVPGVPGEGWYAMPMDFASLGSYYVANPAVYGDTPTDQQVLTWSDALNHPIWTSGGGGGGGNQVYVVTNAQVASASGTTTSDKITSAIGVASPDEGDVTIVTGLPDDVYEGLYFFTTQWVKGASYAYPSASEVIYNNVAHPTLGATVQAAINDLDDGLIATTAIANTANSTATSALSIASAALPRAGGTMTGVLNTVNVNVQSGHSIAFSGGANGNLDGMTDSTSLTSSTVAASATAVKDAYDLANGALSRTGGTMTGVITFDSGQIFPVSGIQDATTSQKGVVQIGTNIDVVSGVISVKTADTSNLGLVRIGTNVDVASGIISVKTADTSNLGLVQVGTNIDVTSGVISVKTASASQLGLVQVGSNINVTGGGTISVNSSSTTTPGVVQLNDTNSSFSTTQALTANQGRLLQNQINSLTVASNTKLAGSLNCSTGKVDSVTTDGLAAGFVVGNNPPNPAAGNANYYLIVTVGSASYSPPGGGGPYAPQNGDWFLSNGTAWQYLGVGSRPAYASTTTAGIVQLATNSDTQAGVNSTLAVTPAGLQSKVSDSVTTVSSTTVASSTAAKTAKDAADAAQATANAALPKAGGTMTGDIFFSGPSLGIVFNDLSTVEAISDSTSITSSLTAASSTAVKAAYDLGFAALPKAGGTMTGDLTFSGSGIGVVFNDASTVEAISDSTSTTSSVTAASSTAVKSAYDLGVAALPKTGGTMTGAITFAAGQVFPVSGIQDATTGQKGVVQIGTNIQVSSGTISVNTATTGQLGLVQVGSNIDVSSGTISVKSASTTQAGIVQLNDTVTSTSTTQALTANQGKALQDQINALSVSSNITFAGTINGSNGLLLTVTAEGAAVGFTVGSPLPAASSTVAEYFVIVSTAGTMTPPGGSPTAVQVGDWWLASASAWNYIAAGYTPVAASTTTAGIVQLATNAETQAGVNTAKAVVPSALQSKMSDSTSTTSSTTIASSTAVKSAYDLANAAVPKSSYTALGALVTGTGAGTIGTLSTGTNGQFLAVNSACSTGLQWCTLSLACVPCSAYTGVGSILVGTNPAGTFTALPVGTNGQVVVANSACSSGVQWATCQGLSLCGYTCTATPFSTAIGSSAGTVSGAATNITAIGYNAGCSITSGSCNTFVGTQAGLSNTTGSNNTHIGYQTGYFSTTGTDNTTVGSNAGQNLLAGSFNVFLGSLAGSGVASGSCNVAIGYDALNTAYTGLQTIAIGRSSGTNLTSGACNTLIGHAAGFNATTGCNTVVGWCGLATATTGSFNTVVGIGAGQLGTNPSSLTAVGHTAGQYSNVTGTTAIGRAALQNSTTGINTAVGYFSLQAVTTGASNTALGYNSGILNTGDNNTFVGHNSGCAQTTGAANTFVGATAGTAVSTGTCNVAMGYGALTAAATSGNVAIGAFAGAATTSGNNTLVGFCAGASLTNTSQNVFIGYLAGRGVTTGQGNIGIGCGAMAANNAGSNNIAIGFSAGEAMTVAGNNTFIGPYAGRGVTTGSSNVFLGFYSGTASQSNNIVFADGAGNVRQQFNSSGALNFDGTNYGTAGQILQSNGSAAVPTWVTSWQNVTATLTTTSTTTLLSLPVATTRSVQMFLTVSNTTTGRYHSDTYQILTDGTTATSQLTGGASIGAGNAYTWSVTVSAGNLLLQVTPQASSSTKFTAQYFVTPV